MPCNRSSQLSYTPIEGDAKIEKISLHKKANKKNKSALKQKHSKPESRIVFDDSLIGSFDNYPINSIFKR
jgi:hypothetical protein